MRPNIGDSKVDKLLSQFAQRYTNSTYIAEMILPVLSVKEKTGKFAKFGKENFRVYTSGIYRAPGTRAHSVDYSVSQGSYSTSERSLEHPVADEEYANSDDPYDPRRDATSVLMDNLMVNKERALATALTSTSILTLNTTLSGTSQWSDYSNSDPVTNIETAINAVRVATGSVPNSAWMSFVVFYKLKNHPDIREEVKYTNGGQFNDDAFIAWLKGKFRLENVYVGSAVYNSADEGQTDSLADVWGKDFGVFYKSPTPTIMRATFGYTFSDTPIEVDMYREESHRRDVIRARNSFDQNIMDANLAYLIKDAVA